MDKLKRLSSNIDKIQEYLDKNFTNIQIAKIFNCKANDIYKTCKKYNLKKNYVIKHPNLIIDYFKKIDTIEKSYWLGFLYADGYINKHESVILALAIKDLDHIKKFCKCIGANCDKIVLRTHNNKSNSVSCSVTISKKEFGSYLINHGCTNKKSKTIRFPTNLFMNENFKLAFLMGYYDGDGSQSGSELYCGSRQFLDDIKFNYNVSSDIKISSKLNVFILTLGKHLKEKMVDAYPYGLVRKQGLFKYKHNPELKRNNSRSRPQKKKFEITKDKLNEMINVEKLSYKKIGRLFGVSDNSIKKRAKNFGIELPIRNKYNALRKIKQGRLAESGLL